MRRRSAGTGTATEVELEALARRILALLALSEQSDERFRGGPIEALYLRHGSPREDGGEERMGNWSLPFQAGRGLYELVRRERLERTLEVGMAHGSSTLFIAQAMRDAGVGAGAEHVAIDPWQARGFGRAGVQNLRQAGLAERVTVLEEPNYQALPRLAAERPGGFQLAFIDGLHLFDHVVLDLFYCDLLLEGRWLPRVR